MQKEIKIFFADLTPEKKQELLKTWGTTEEKENWASVPLFAMVREFEEESEEDCASFTFDRNYYSVNIDKKIYFSLGNFSDAGWFWSTTDEGIFLALFRLKKYFIDKRKKEEETEFKEKVLTNKKLQEYYAQHKKDADEIGQLVYGLTGDNKVHVFGDGYLSMMDEDLNFDKYEDKIEEAWNAVEKQVKDTVAAEVAESLPETLEEFWKDYLTKAIADDTAICELYLDIMSRELSPYLKEEEEC